MTKVLSKAQNQESPASLVSQIDALQSELYSAKGLDILGIKGNPKFAGILDFLRDMKFNLESFDSQNIDRKELSKTLEEAKNLISNLPVLRVKIANDKLGQDFWRKVSFWIKENLMENTQFLFDTEVDPEIIGGIVIYWKGRVVDLSLKRFLSDFYAKEIRYVFR
jgi:hypothetical protein